jgi:putative membrane protein
MTSLAALPAFLAHFAAGVALLAAAIALHMRLTPHDELALIRGGSAGAAVALAGVVVGFALPIGSAISHSAGALDAAVWGLVALLAQQGAFLLCTRVLLPDWRAALEQRGELAGSAVKTAAAVAVGLLNAACLTT